LKLIFWYNTLQYGCTNKQLMHR